MEQWQVQRTAGCCAGTGRKLESGEEYYAALIDQQTFFERRDFSVGYWQEHQPEVFSFWKTRIPQPSQKNKMFVDDGMLINFFERLAGETESLKVNFRFVLGLILMRKRLLKYEDSRREDGREAWTVRLVRDKETSKLINPDLDDEQIELVSRELSTILQGEL